MGVDKPNVRFIINYGLPESIETYYQQSGRGGRDGEPAVSIIFWSPSDMNRNRFFANCTGAMEARAQARRDYQVLSDYVTDTVTCRRKILLSYFGEECDNNGSTSTNEECCDNCTHRPRTRKDLTTQAHVLISAVSSSSYPTRKNILEFVQKTAKTKLWLYSSAWWQELLLLLRIEGYLEYNPDTTRFRVTQKGTDAMNGKYTITVPATNAIVAEIHESGKIVLPTVKEGEEKEGLKETPKGSPAKRVLPSSFNTMVVIPNKKVTVSPPPLIDKISQARKDSGSSRYTGQGFGFMKSFK